MAEQVDTGAIINATTIPIEPYDTLRSLALKAQVVGNDLLVRAVADFAAFLGAAPPGVDKAVTALTIASRPTTGSTNLMRPRC